MIAHADNLLAAAIPSTSATLAGVTVTVASDGSASVNDTLSVA